MNKQSFYRLKPVAWLLRKLNPSFAVCSQCGVPWSHTNPHFADYTTKHGERRGIFAVCEYCYRTMTDEQLIQAYENLYRNVWKDCKKDLSYVAFRSIYMKDIRARKQGK